MSLDLNDTDIDTIRLVLGVTILLSLLRLFGVIDWEWVWILAGIWLPIAGLAIIGVIFGGLIVLLFVGELALTTIYYASKYALRIVRVLLEIGVDFLSDGIEGIVWRVQRWKN